MYARPMIMERVLGTDDASCCLNRHGGNYRKVAESPGQRKQREGPAVATMAWHVTTLGFSCLYDTWAAAA